MKGGSRSFPRTMRECHRLFMLPGRLSRESEVRSRDMTSPAAFARYVHGRQRGRPACNGRCLVQLCKPEIEDGHAAVRAHHDVAGFRSRCVMPLAWAAASASASGMATPSRLQRQAAWRDQVAQELAFQQLHREEPNAIYLLNGVNRHDVRVVQRRRGAGFLLEAMETLAVSGERGGQDLDRDLAAEARIAGAIHFAHPAHADPRRQLVRPELLTLEVVRHHRVVERHSCRRLQKALRALVRRQQQLDLLLHRLVAAARLWQRYGAGRLGRPPESARAHSDNFFTSEPRLSGQRVMLREGGGVLIDLVELTGAQE